MLTDEQLMEMAPEIDKMINTVGWQHYMQIVAEKIEMEKDFAINDEPGMLLFHRGAIIGLQAAIQMASDTVAQARFTSGEKQEARRRVLGQRLGASTLD